MGKGRDKRRRKEKAREKKAEVRPADSAAASLAAKPRAGEPPRAEPDAGVWAPLKPRPAGQSGAVALPLPEPMTEEALMLVGVSVR